MQLSTIEVNKKKNPIEKSDLKKNANTLITLSLINTIQKAQINDLKEKNFVIVCGFLAMSALTLLSLTLFRRIEMKKI